MYVKCNKVVPILAIWRNVARGSLKNFWEKSRVGSNPTMATNRFAVSMTVYAVQT